MHLCGIIILARPRIKTPTSGDIQFIIKGKGILGLQHYGFSFLFRCVGVDKTIFYYMH